MTNQFVVYQTHYSGDLLPPYYIGSTTRAKIESGTYFGSEKDVVKSPEFFNESTASINGMFGRDVSGKNNPMFGKTRADSRERMLGDLNIAKRDDVRAKLRLAKVGYVTWIKNKQHSDETKRKMSNARIGVSPSTKGNNKYNKECDEILRYLTEFGTASRKDLLGLFTNISEMQFCVIIKRLKSEMKIKKVGGHRSDWILYS